MRVRSAIVAAIAAAVVMLAVALDASGQKPKSGAKATKPAKSDPTLSAIVRPAEAAEIAALPKDPAKTLVTQRCLLCHGAGLIAQQHKDAAAWGRTVTQMRTWGTPIQDEDQAAIVAYLAKHFGPAAAR
jgi:cytochrome c5